MKPENHINQLLNDTHWIQIDGHCNGNAPAWVAINDIEIAIHDLRKAFEEKINNTSERSNKWKRLKRLGRTFRRWLSAAIGG